MPESRRPALEDHLLAVFLAAASAAFAVSRGGGLFWTALVPALPALFWRHPATDVGARHLRRAAGTLVVAAVLVGIYWTLYPVFDEGQLRLVAEGLGVAAAVLGPAAFSLRSPHFGPGSAALPSALVLLGLSWLTARPDALPHVPTGFGAAALAGALAVGGRRGEPAAAARLWRAGGFLGTAGALAAGIVSFLPWFQPQVERTAARLLIGDSGNGLADSSSLGELEELSLSSKLVLRAYTGVPQRLRGRVFTVFDGRTWRAGASAGRTVLSVLPEPAPWPSPLGAWLRELPGVPYAVADPPSTPLVSTKIVPVALSGPVVPVSPRAVTLPAPGGVFTAEGLLLPAPWPPVEMYGVVNEPAAIRPDAGDVASALALPPRLDPRIRELADRLSTGQTTAAAKAAATLDHLRRHYTYSLKVGRFRTSDAMAEFLFEKKQGYCEYFASAAVLLLRLQGVPARYVVGYNVTDDNRTFGHYVVREKHAHAWIDAHLGEHGWVEMDPTPPAQYAAAHPPEGGVAAWLEAIRAWFSELSARVWQGDWGANLRWLAATLVPPVAVVAAAALFAAILERLRRLWRGRATRRRPADGDDLPPAVAALLRRLDRRLARRGFPRPASRAPREHLHSLPEGALSPSLRAAAERAVDYVYEARFAGRPPAAHDVESAVADLEAAARRDAEGPSTLRSGPAGGPGT